MRCEEIRRFAHLYIDGEFDEREKTLFNEHLSECSSCRREVAELLEFRNALREKLASQKAPLEVRNRLTSVVLAAADEYDSKSRLALSAAIVASMLLIIAASAIYLHFAQSPSDDLANIVEQSVAAHEASLPPELNGIDEKTQGFLAQQVGTDPSPPFREDETTHLVGARLTHIGPSKAILFRYVHRGRRVSVVRLPRPLDLASLPRADTRRTRVIYKGARNGHSITLYERPGHTDTVVADLPAPEMLKLIPVNL